MHIQQPNRLLPDPLRGTGPSERELYSGKVPLRPIHRAGFLVGGVTFVAFSCAMFAFAFSSMRGTNVLIKALLLTLALCWFLLFFTLGRRMIWSAIVAPSESNEEEDEMPHAPNKHTGR